MSFYGKFGVTERSRCVNVKRGNRLVCLAIESNKFKFTPEGTVDNAGVAFPLSERLVSDFKAYFPDITIITTSDQVLDMVNASKAVAEWYKHWSGINSIASSMPAFMDKTDIKQVETWRRCEISKRSYDEKQKVWSKRVDDAAATLKNVVKDIEREKNSAIEGLEHCILINLINQNHLSASDAALLVTISDKVKRKEKAKELVLKLQKELMSKPKQETLDILKQN